MPELTELVDGRAGSQDLNPESGHCQFTILPPELMHTWGAFGGLHSIRQLPLSYSTLLTTTRPSSAHQYDSGSYDSPLM